LEQVLALAELEQLRQAGLEEAPDSAPEAVSVPEAVKARAAAQAVVSKEDRASAVERALVDLVRAGPAQVEPALAELVQGDRVRADGEVGLEDLGEAREQVRVRVRDLAGELATGQSTFQRSRNRTFKVY
jgi:hypothetical protein